MSYLAELQPRSRRRVFDLVELAGFDTRNWIESSNNPQGHTANPKYCYEWSFVQPGRFVILNVWHSAMEEKGGQIVVRDNFREHAEYHRNISLKSTWAKRAQKLDDALKIALAENLAVRVIIIDGIRRSKDDPERRASSVTARDLDPEPWTITSYDQANGQFELTRGIFAQQCVDQFDLDMADKAGPARIEVTASAFVRDPAVRRRVLIRSQGYCELCGQVGFRMANGALYLETHHIIPLALGGSDDDSNVAALCAHNHRRAHYADDRDDIAQRLLARSSVSNSKDFSTQISANN